MSSATAHVNNTMTTGQLVREAAGGFHELAVASTAKLATGDGGWVDKGFVDEATLHIELGEVTGTNPTAVFVLEQADLSDGTGAVELLRTPQADTTDDVDYYGYTRINKRYIRLSWTIGGTDTPTFPATATLQTSHYRQDLASGAWA